MNRQGKIDIKKILNRILSRCTFMCGGRIAIRLGRESYRSLSEKVYLGFRVIKARGVPGWFCSIETNVYVYLYEIQHNECSYKNIGYICKRYSKTYGIKNDKRKFSRIIYN